MSGIDPGRPKIEERAAAYISTGTRMLDDDGLEWIVTVEPIDEPGKTRLLLHRMVGDLTYRTAMTVSSTLHLRCRVEEEDR